MNSLMSSHSISGAPHHRLTNQVSLDGHGPVLTPTTASCAPPVYQPLTPAGGNANISAPPSHHHNSNS